MSSSARISTIVNDDDDDEVPLYEFIFLDGKSYSLQIILNFSLHQKKIKSVIC